MANEVAAQKTESLSNSEAFTNKVLREFGSIGSTYISVHLTCSII